MASINQVTITGNLGKDCEVRATAGGTTVVTFSVAVSERQKQGGEWKDVVHWIPCVMYGTRADSLSKFLVQGTKVGVAGKLRYSKWEDNGKTRSKIEVVVNDLELLSPRKNDTQQSHNATQDVSLDDWSEPFPF